MKRLNHTPGPWLQSWDCNSPTGSDNPSKYEGFEIVDSEGWPVAFVPVYFAKPPIKSQVNKIALDWDEAAANLVLLSQAPNLLDALIKISKIQSENSIGEIREIAIKAIAGVVLS